MDALVRHKCRSPRQHKLSVIKKLGDIVPAHAASSYDIKVDLHPTDNPLNPVYRGNLLLQNLTMLMT